jgi:hypothetical protein
VRDDERCEDRDRRQQEDEPGPDRAERPAAHELADGGPPAGRRLGGRDVGQDLDRRVDRHSSPQR